MKTSSNKLPLLVARKSMNGEPFFAIILRYKYEKKSRKYKNQPIKMFMAEFDLDAELMAPVIKTFTGRNVHNAYAKIIAECLQLHIRDLYVEK